MRAGAAGVRDVLRPRLLIETPEGIIVARKEGKAMAVPTEPTKPEHREAPFEEKIAHLRATPEEIARLVGNTPPFDFDTWMDEARSGDWTPEDEAEIQEWLAEREAMRPHCSQRLEEKLAELDE
jgi:hypothetical protein